MPSYLVLKSLHLVFVIAWFAGLFYIFRLFVYHSRDRKNESVHQLLLTMERKLLSIIMLPAAILTALFGFLLVYENPLLLQQKWLHLKWLAVFFLIAYHAFSEYVHRQFKKGNFFLSEKACRLINEVPTLLLIAVVFLAVLKPWR